MVFSLNPRFAATASPPIMEARRWLESTPRNPDYELLNLSQAAPVAAPPEAMCRAMSEFAMTDVQAHVYGPVLGDPDLRQEIARHWSAAYAGEIRQSQVAVTSGCNQAFVAVVSTLAGSGDSVIITAPWYFNHKMWLDMMGIEARVPHNGGSLAPDPDAISRSISDTTRAIVLVSPNNPTGAEYSADTVRQVYELAKRKGIALIIDETYRDFDSRPGPLHDLFTDPGWPGSFIHLYSFSKAYRLTGHRVGAIVASEAVLAEIEKFLDSVAICPNRIGQHAALYGMRHLGGWLAEEQREILRRRSAMESGFAGLEEWRLLGCGAYFAYVEYPFEVSSDRFVLKLLSERGILVLPGTMFAQDAGVGTDRQLRIAYANVGQAGIGELFTRLDGYWP